MGEFKSVIATLERLTALYPNNIDLKLYLLSVAVKTDSTEKVLRLIDEIRQSDEITDDVKKELLKLLMISIKNVLMMKKLLQDRKQDKL